MVEKYGSERKAPLEINEICQPGFMKKNRVPMLTVIVTIFPSITTAHTCIVIEQKDI